MTQAERDRLVALKKAKKKLITQKQAAEELGITERHVRRLLRALKRRGDKAVAHVADFSGSAEQRNCVSPERPVWRRRRLCSRHFKSCISAM
ncbi:MAG TPA: helix-turn-helix domain-containing protein [Bryobacteraceae bacterium]|nr:helix-turn-helix domain-containing protein [Bryobacteraceae bacterium]